MRQKLAKFIGKALRELNLSWRKEALAKKRKLANEAGVFSCGWRDLDS